MKISVCITTFNEEASIGKLLDSLIAQTKRPDEIIIVDGGSVDSTLSIISHYQKKYQNIHLLKESCSRAVGRNLAVEMAKNEIVAMTDAGCVAKKTWLENLTAPFETQIDVVAGFYKMASKNNLQKAMSVYLGVLPNNFDIEFLPSTRSIAFTKQIWEKVGGFPEFLTGAAEDTVFNYKLLQNNAKISRVKNSIVEWGMPGDIKSFFLKVEGYAKGDVKSKVWVFPKKGAVSHNIKATSVFLRYFLGLFFLYLFLLNNLTPLLVVIVLLYFAWAYRKILLAFGDYKLALWGPVLQLGSDFAVMSGFLKGVL